MTIRDWRNLAGACALQAVAAAAIRVMRLSAVRSTGARVQRVARLGLNGPEARVVWALEATGRRLPGLSTCLVRALVAEVVLESSQPLCLTIGVTRLPTGALAAHAWLTRDGHVIVGGVDTGAYAELVSWHNRVA